MLRKNATFLHVGTVITIALTLVIPDISLAQNDSSRSPGNPDLGTIEGVPPSGGSTKELGGTTGTGTIAGSAKDAKRAKTADHADKAEHANSKVDSADVAGYADTKVNNAGTAQSCTDCKKQPQECSLPTNHTWGYRCTTTYPATLSKTSGFFQFEGYRSDNLPNKLNNGESIYIRSKYYDVNMVYFGGDFKGTCFLGYAKFTCQNGTLKVSPKTCKSYSMPHPGCPVDPSGNGTVPIPLP